MAMALKHRSSAPGSDDVDDFHVDEDEARRYRALERAWQDEVGSKLLDGPFDAPGSATVFEWQFDRLVELIDPDRAGVVIEIGCGRGHFLSRLRAAKGMQSRTLIGLDLSAAVRGLPERGLLGVQADGERLPFRAGTVDYVIYDGSLHHCIHYPNALREAVRVLAPGGSIIIFEPVVSGFSQLMHRLLDPIVFRLCGTYESPIDQRYKGAFRREIVKRALTRQGLEVSETSSDFLAYPLTGCYAGSAFGRSESLMRFVISVERAIAATPLIGRLANSLAWRFTMIGTRPQGDGVQILHGTAAGAR